jgi:putative membrane protein
MIALPSMALVIAETWDMHDWGAGWWIVMMLGMLVFWALVIVGIVWVVRELGGGRSERDRESPVDVLQRRLAEGDISVEEYERRRQALQASGRT